MFNLMNVSVIIVYGIIGIFLTRTGMPPVKGVKGKERIRNFILLLVLSVCMALIAIITIIFLVQVF